MQRIRLFGRVVRLLESLNNAESEAVPAVRQCTRPRIDAGVQGTPAEVNCSRKPARFPSQRTCSSKKKWWEQLICANAPWLRLPPSTIVRGLDGIDRCECVAMGRQAFTYGLQLPSIDIGVSSWGC